MRRGDYGELYHRVFGKGASREACRQGWKRWQDIWESGMDLFVLHPPGEPAPRPHITRASIGTILGADQAVLHRNCVPGYRRCSISIKTQKGEIDLIDRPRNEKTVRAATTLRPASAYGCSPYLIGSQTPVTTMLRPYKMNRAVFISLQARRRMKSVAATARSERGTATKSCSGPPF